MIKISSKFCVKLPLWINHILTIHISNVNMKEGGEEERKEREKAREREKKGKRDGERENFLFIYLLRSVRRKIFLLVFALNKAQEPL